MSNVVYLSAQVKEARRLEQVIELIALVDDEDRCEVMRDLIVAVFAKKPATPESISL